MIKNVNLLLLLLLLLLSTSCQQEPVVETIVVTEVVLVEQQEVMVTRVVRQTVAVTATPAPVVVEEEPVVLDVGYVGVFPNGEFAFPNVDPQQADDENGVNLIENLFVGLTRFNHETNRAEPELAQSWHSENGREWTFQLRDDVYWVRPDSDARGEAAVERVRRVVAADVVYAVRRACNRDIPTPDAVLLFVIQGCERIYNLAEPTPDDLQTIGVAALDDQTLRVTLVQPAAHFLTITSMPLFYPVPAAELVQWQEEPGSGTWMDEENLLTSGPFYPQPQSWLNTRVMLRRNPEWPLPFSGNVEVVYLNLFEAEENAFRLWDAKSLDISPLPTTERDTMLEDRSPRVQLVTDQTVFYLGFNFDSGVFREPEVRRAFSAAIDRERLVEVIYGGRAVPMRHLAPPGVVGAAPVDQVGVGYSPDYARQQMEASGFRSCRLMPPVTFMISSFDLSLEQAELIREMWVAELNCDEGQIRFEQVQFGTLLANTRADAGAARPDLWELGWASYYPDAHNWVGDLLHCTDSENRQNRPCATVDEMVRQAAGTVDPDERVALYRQIENLLFGPDGIVPVIPLYVRGNYWLVQNWLTYTPASFGGEQFDTYVIDDVTKELERELERSRE